MLSSPFIISDSTFQEEIHFLSTFIPEALYSQQESNAFIDDVLSLFYQQETLFSTVEPSLPTITDIDVHNVFDHWEKWGDSALEQELQELLQEYKRSNKANSTFGLANLIADLGREVFGCYLPMHAFFNSRSTQWGIYLYPQLIKKRAVELFLERPHEGVSLLDYYKIYYIAVYRHELFHYQTERFATKMEVATLKPVYKPYTSNVYDRTQHTPDWLEEALAEASVMDSSLVVNRTKIKGKIIRDIYEYDLQFMPPGHRDYKCEQFGGTYFAHLLFAAQIIQGKVEPSHVSTYLLTVKGEFGSNDRHVPVYEVTNLPDYIVNRMQ